mgnify:CR=1 FL=1
MRILLESIIMQSLDELYSKDKFLIDNKVAERDIVHRFACNNRFVCAIYSILDRRIMAENIQTIRTNR